MTSDELYKRLLTFAINCQTLVKRLPSNVYNKEYGKQLIRSSASPGANYIEAIEAISRKDFIHRIKICRKESKESTHWLFLIENSNKLEDPIQKEIAVLHDEAGQFIKIFTSTILTSERKLKL